MKKKLPNNSLITHSSSKTFKKVNRSFSVERAKPAYAALPEKSFPTVLLPLVGRKQEMAAICALLQQPEVRLLTLTGPGGVGKTRLALQVPTEVDALFPDGICFVSLVPLLSADSVLSTIAQALGLTERDDTLPLALILDAMRDKRFLLILDNFEHVAMAAPQLKELLAGCPHLKVVVTSRIVLGLLEEQEFHVNPLALPDLAHLLPCEDLSQVEAVSLFLQRVRTVRPDFAMNSENALTIARICVYLDGLPLALELAAARMKLFSPQGILMRLDRRLSLLTSGPRDAPERHQTLRKTIEWSYDLLTKVEQQLFRRLAVFVDGCSLQAIEAINHDMMKEQDEPLLNVISSLIDQSWLNRLPQTHDQEQRFMMLAIIREYALECLQSSEEEQEVRQMHAEYYLTLARSLEQKVMGDQSSHWIAWIESEFENLRAAFGWFLSSKDAERALEMSGSLWAFWLQSSTLEGCHWINQALECCQQSTTPVSTDTKAMAIHTASMLEYYRGNWQEADRLAEQALQLFQSTNNLASHARVLITQGVGALLQNQYALAGKFAHESLCLGQKVLTPWLSAEALLVEAYSHYFQGDSAQAYTLGKQAYTLSRQTGELYSIIRTTHAYALFANAQKDSAEVQALYETIVEMIAQFNDTTATFSPIAVCLIGLGAIAALQKQYIKATHLWGKAKVLYKRRDGLSELEPHKWLFIILGTHLLYAQVIETVYAQLGKQAFKTAWQEGQSMALSQLLCPEASGDQEPRSATKDTRPYSDELTAREKEVLRLLAQGLSSASIAKQLVISLVTVNTHIRAIYSKLGVSSRSAATRFALEHHLV